MKTYERNIDGLIEWLKDGDPATTYEWFSFQGDCLLARFAKAAGMPPIGAVYHQFIPDFDIDRTTIESQIAHPRPHTYGAALKRAIAWKAEHDV